MTFKLTQRSYEEVLAKFEQALSWTQSLGISFPRSRITQYRKHMQDLIRARADSNIDALLEQGMFRSLVNSSHEVTQINAIYDGLQRYPVTPELVRRIRKAIRGPEFVEHESTADASHEGRDFAFELSIASLFSRAGYDWDPSSTTDVFVTDAPIRFHIECKRPTKNKAVRSAVNKGLKQLNTSLNNPGAIDTSYGLLAIAIDTIVVPKGKFLEAQTPDSIDRRVQEETENFIRQHGIHWAVPRAKRIIGTLIVLRMPTVVKSLNILTSAGFIAVNPIVSKQDLSYSVLEMMRTKLLPVISE